jgi:hypothetical protein
MKKAYVILKKGFEYDDNIYSENDGGGGNPSLICFSKPDAIKKVRELNILEYKQVAINQYTYELEDSLNVSHDEYLDFNKSLVLKYGEIKKRYSYEETEYMLHPLANEEESDKYSKMVDIDFYEMVETDVDMESYRDYKIDTILE